MRGLSPSILGSLMEENGILSPVLKKVQQDHSLMLAIRKGYINIYYRGGNILKITEGGNDSFSTFFADDYSKDGIEPSKGLPSQIKTTQHSEEWVRALPYLKEVMDSFFSLVKNKPEREFQQLVARENNYSTVSNETEYFISDIEFNEKSIGARFDLMAIRWLANQRQNGANCRAAFVEMKYGDDALKGDAGLVKHLKDMEELISSVNYENILKTMEAQFNQLDQLGLVTFNRSKKFDQISIDRKQKPEVIFLLANHNPRSTTLRSILEHEEFNKHALSDCFDLRFFVSSFAGYAFHSNCMKTLSEFKELL